MMSGGDFEEGAIRELAEEIGTGANRLFYHFNG
ncbi:hypothetical protein ACF3NG_11380 [Aerococcaceae bacterium WGS1372]